MSTPQLERLQAHCQRLRLYQVAAELPSLLEQAAKAERSYTDFLEEVLRREVQAKTDKHLAMRLAMARFPFQKTLETFDFKVQPSIDVKLIRELGTGRYLEQGENALFLGPPGVGQMRFADAGRPEEQRIWPWPWASRPVNRATASCLRPPWGSSRRSAKRSPKTGWRTGSRCWPSPSS